MSYVVGAGVLLAVGVIQIVDRFRKALRPPQPQPAWAHEHLSDHEWSEFVRYINALR